jgi:TetR/AcrR family transcriptional regulator
MPRKPKVAAKSQPADDGRRGRILDAALAVFAERGFEGARTRDIAERAGANLGLLTYYFQDKNGLWRAAVSRAFAHLQAELAEVLTPMPDDDDVVALARLVRRFVHFVARYPAFMQLMNDEGKRDSPRLRWLADRYVGPLYALIRTRVEHAQAAGRLPPSHPAHIHYLVLGGAGLVFSQAAECRRVAGVDPTTEAFADAHADVLLQLLGVPPTARR